MSSRRNMMIGGIVLLSVGLLALLIITGITLHEVEETEDAACPYQESVDCWDGNGCHAPLKKSICRLEGAARATAPGVCDAANYVCENPVYPDGTCCDKNDFCFLPDENKTCQQGQCVSADATLCKGYCAIDADCTDSVYAIPFYDTVTQTTFCLNGACFAYAFVTTNMVISPNDLLNRTTLATRNISACLESVCFIFDSEGDVQICQYAWTCSQLNGFSDQARKRDFVDASPGAGGAATRPTHQFRLPNHGRYTLQEQRQANAELNRRLGAFAASLRATTAPPTA